MFDPLDDLEAAVDKLAASEAAVDVPRLARLAERLEFQRLRAVAALDRSGAWRAEGALTTASWLREHCRLTHGAANASVRLARRLDILPTTAIAFEAGAISRQHASVIADACTPERASAIQGLEPQLVDAARQVHVARTPLARVACRRRNRRRWRLRVSERSIRAATAPCLTPARRNGCDRRLARPRVGRDGVDGAERSDGRAHRRREPIHRAATRRRARRFVPSGHDTPCQRPPAGATTAGERDRGRRGTRASGRCRSGAASARRRRARRPAVGRNTAPHLVRRRNRARRHRGSIGAARRRPHDTRRLSFSLACARGARRRLRSPGM